MTDRLTIAFIEYTEPGRGHRKRIFLNSKYVLRVLKISFSVSSTGLRKYTLYQYYNNACWFVDCLANVDFVQFVDFVDVDI